MPEYIPNTTVRLCANVPLDNTYTDTRWFASAGDQTSFFASKAIRTYTNFTYQRVNSSVAPPRIAYSVRVPEVADNLYTCNYLMFQNTNYGTKWFYAFIEKVNYINPNNTEIIYEIDYLQTFMFDLQIKPCFVEREHSLTDVLYANLTPEPLNVPQALIASVEDLDPPSSHNIVVGVNATPEDETVANDTSYNGIFSGVELHNFTSASEANSFIRSYDTTAKSAAIVAVFNCSFDPTTLYNIDSHTISRPQSFFGYTPRNNKVMTYPFCYMQLSDRNGQTDVFQYEYFATYTYSAGTDSGVSVSPQPLRFNTSKTGGINPKITCVAVGYMGDTTGNAIYAKNKVMEIDAAIPACWTSDAYANFVSGEYTKRNGNIILGTLASAGTNAIGGFMAAGPVGAAIGAATAVIGGVSSFAQNANDAWQMKNNPGLTTNNSTSGNYLSYQLQNVGFSVQHMALPPEILQEVDTFFDMYGYQVNRVKMPNLTGRASWNFVKLRNPIIVGSVPVEGMAIIKAAFSRGIRLWHVDAVGDFNQQNPIAG